LQRKVLGLDISANHMQDGIRRAGNPL